MTETLGFDAWGDALSEATLLVASDGLIVAANRKARALLGSLGEIPHALAHVVAEPEDRVAACVQAWARSTQRTPTTLTFRCADGTLLPCRCDGASVRQGTPSLVMVQVQSQAKANARFALLNRKIDELNAEVQARRSAEEQLWQLNTRLEQEVERRTEELRVANDALRVRNQELHEFAYVASHDLQEPLRKITVFADLLRREHAHELAGDGAFFVERMQYAAERMSRLIKDLLAFSRIATEKKPFVPVDLNDVLADVLELLSLRIRETGGHVEVGTLPVVQGDASQIHQLFQNLVSNALKFHRPGEAPQVRVYASPTGCDPAHPDAAPGWHVTVADNGVGFDSRYSDRIFNAFQRLHTPHEYEGTGIGLAICRRIAEQHQGTICAQSHKGRGSRFTVWLPMSEEAGISTPPKPDNQSVGV